MTQRIHPSEQHAETEATETKAVEAEGVDTTSVEATSTEPKPRAARELTREARKEAPGEPPQGPPKPKSTWMLSAASQPLSREELLARYRRERALPEDPFAESGKPTPPPGYRDKIMTSPPAAARFVERLQTLEEPKPAAPRAGLNLLQILAVTATMALAAGVGIGLVNARFLASSGAAPDLAAMEPAVAEAGTTSLPPLQKAPDAQAIAPQMTVITKKPVPIATLEVADVTGETNSYIPLALHAEPAGMNGDIMLKISGIPDGAYLTSGRREQDNLWALSLDESKDVKLVVPQASQPQLDLAVAAFEPKTGELAAPVKTMTVALSNATVLPASAPPPQQVSAPQLKTTAAPAVVAPAPIPPPESINLASQVPDTPPETRQLVLDGDEALRNGDIKAARSAYEKAWNKGAADGAFGLGRSYDAVALAALDITRAKPDKAKAISWYERAASAGNTDAAAAIVRLNLKP